MTIQFESSPEQNEHIRKTLASNGYTIASFCRRYRIQNAVILGWMCGRDKAYNKLGRKLKPYGCISRFIDQFNKLPQSV